MAKLDPKDLKDEPIVDDFLATHPEQLTPEQKFIAKIKGMMVGDEYAFAYETLSGILQTVTRTNRVTEGQRKAIENIADHPWSGTIRDRRKVGW